MRSLSFLVRCGQHGASVTAAAVAGAAAETDSITLASFYGYVDEWRDSQIMDAVLSVARGPHASARARANAVRHLLGLLYRRFTFNYSPLISGAEIVSDGPDQQLAVPGCHASMDPRSLASSASR
jgi:hypothetical protein